VYLLLVTQMPGYSYRTYSPYLCSVKDSLCVWPSGLGSNPKSFIETYPPPPPRGNIAICSRLHLQTVKALGQDGKSLSGSTIPIIIVSNQCSPAMFFTCRMGQMDQGIFTCAT
jgi:hypothetical protein